MVHIGYSKPKFIGLSALQNVSSISRNGRLHGARSGDGSKDVLALKVGQEGGGAVAEGTGGTEEVDLTVTAQVGGAVGGGAGGRGGEHLAGKRVGLDLDGDVLEDVALRQDHGARVDLEGVAG